MVFKAVLVVVFHQRWAAAFPELGHAEVELPRGFHVLGNQTEGFTGLNSRQSLFERQSCPQAYNNCGYIGECCPVNAGPTCCGLLCIGLQPAGTTCCSGYMCPPQWRCCGTSGNNCSPTNGVCCSSDGRFCPANWSCCGNQGGCYPTKGFHCCSNNGIFCPDGYSCVYCSGSTTEICCQGTGGGQIPVYRTDLPTGTSVTSIPIPEPTTEESASTKPTITSRITASRATVQTSEAIQYYTTTFTYYYIIWTRMTFVQSTVESTTTTTSTILSVSATDSAEALTTLRSMASDIQKSASSSALDASPVDTSGTTIRETVTPTARAGSGASILRSGSIFSMIAGGIAFVLLY